MPHSLGVATAMVLSACYQNATTIMECVCTSILFSMWMLYRGYMCVFYNGSCLQTITSMLVDFKRNYYYSSSIFNTGHYVTSYYIYVHCCSSELNRKSGSTELIWFSAGFRGISPARHAVTLIGGVTLKVWLN